MNPRRALVLPILLAAALPALGAAAPAPTRIVLRDVTKDTGITFTHTDGGSSRRYIVETVTAGLALLDYDGDGDIDIYFVNGAPLAGAPAPSAPPRNALYRNDGGFKFTDVTDRAGVGDAHFGLGVAAGDYDNDGDPDLYVTNWGPNVLYRNNGDGTFTHVTAAAGVADGDSKVGAGAAFLDIDNDGDLDLFAANYVKFAYDKHIPRTRRGVPIYPGPLDCEPEPDTLFRNNGDGTFTDISAESGIRAVAGTGMGVVCADYDDDGDTDIVVANDVKANFLYLNDGKGRFQESGLARGIAYDCDGHAHGSMGIDCGDYDNDGLLDFYVTSYARESATLYRNVGGGLLEDVTIATGAGDGTFLAVTWGVGFVDFDNDGDLDLFVPTGEIDDTVDRYDDSRTYYTRNVLLMNTGDGRFADVTNVCGDGLEVERSSRGAAFDDLDNDGDVDTVVLNSRREPTILRNDSPRDGHWLQLRLRGTTTNRDAVGSRVKVAAADLVQVKEVHAGRSYQSHFGTRLHFGLGARDRVDRVEVRWLGGATEVFRDIHIDSLVTLTQGGSAQPPKERR